ncbi:hypothetical protein EJ08DRAFT_107791 [Tothia fuscella]|uniref:Uncharacterized protein n=1 Tax=Tothia fuscella TaxID=1048955 RepID=A0A9P4TRY4_9PEZI|nr:hypothetical protein EJ08DRAFT_107791 [Tothia fuscella]
MESVYYRPCSTQIYLIFRPSLLHTPIAAGCFPSCVDVEAAIAIIQPLLANAIHCRYLPRVVYFVDHELICALSLLLSIHAVCGLLR